MPCSPGDFGQSQEVRLFHLHSLAPHVHNRTTTLHCHNRRAERVSSTEGGYGDSRFPKRGGDMISTAFFKFCEARAADEQRPPKMSVMPFAWLAAITVFVLVLPLLLLFLKDALDNRRNRMTPQQLEQHDLKYDKRLLNCPHADCLLL